MREAVSWFPLRLPAIGEARAQSCDTAFPFDDGKRDPYKRLSFGKLHFQPVGNNFRMQENISLLIKVVV